MFTVSAPIPRNCKWDSDGDTQERGISDVRVDSVGDTEVREDSDKDPNEGVEPCKQESDVRGYSDEKCAN